MRERDKVVCLLLFALLLRFECGLHSYSGKGTPPKFGDYEAQRHWMEITVGLPPKLWYSNTTDNDLSYWGLDYPPLSGYQSWLYGKVIQLLDPEAVALGTSRGYETSFSKLLMRWTVVFSDVVCYIPAAFAASKVFAAGPSYSLERLGILALMVLNPALIVIDHGHFQYNGISLGLAAGAAAAIASGHPALGSILYCLSLNHKQMGLYYAPAFFMYLLASSFQNPSFKVKVANIARLGCVVLTTFALLWWPYLTKSQDLAAVATRIFPTRRGLYEDYVANCWCVSSLLFKWKRLFSPPQLVRLCTLTTLAAFLPSMFLQIRDITSSRLLISLSLTSLSFFQFSYQVHEKSFLLPLLPLSMCVWQNPLVMGWIFVVAVCSMAPLLAKDGVGLASISLVLITITVVDVLRRKRSHSKVNKLAMCAGAASMCGMVFAVYLFTHVTPPTKWPYLWDALIVTWCYIHIAALYLLLYVRPQLVVKSF